MSGSSPAGTDPGNSPAADEPLARSLGDAGRNPDEVAAELMAWLGPDARLRHAVRATVTADAVTVEHDEKTGTATVIVQPGARLRDLVAELQLLPPDAVVVGRESGGNWRLVLAVRIDP